MWEIIKIILFLRHLLVRKLIFLHIDGSTESLYSETISKIFSRKNMFMTIKAKKTPHLFILIL